MNHREFSDYLHHTFHPATRFAGFFKYMLPRIECSDPHWDKYVKYMLGKDYEELPEEAIAYLENLSNDKIKSRLHGWIDRGISWGANGYDEGLRWESLSYKIEIHDPKPTRIVNLDDLV